MGKKDKKDRDRDRSRDRDRKRKRSRSRRRDRKRRSRSSDSDSDKDKGKKAVPKASPNGWDVQKIKEQEVENLMPKFTKEELKERTVIIQEIPVGEVKEELLDFFNSAVLAIATAGGSGGGPSGIP